MNPIWNVLEGTAIGFVEIYCILSITDKKRFPDWLSYLIGVALSFLSGFNNTVYEFMDPNLMFFGSFFFIFLVLSKDWIIKRVLTFLVYIGTTIGFEIILEIIAARFGIVESEYSLQVELLRSYSTVLLCSAYLAAIIIYNKRKINSVVLPVIILMLVPMLVFVYVALLLTGKTVNDSITTVAWLIAGLLNLIFVLLYLRYIKVSNEIWEATKEKVVIEQLEDYDKDYFDVVQAEISQARFMRHDVVNYMDQINALALAGDSDSLALARDLCSELESRLDDGECNN